MSPSKLSFAYIATIVVFVLILLFGTFYLNWGQSHYAFALITFSLVLIGIRLDEIAQHLRDVKARLRPAAQQQKQYQDKTHAHLTAIQTTLTSIHESLERLERRNL